MNANIRSFERRLAAQGDTPGVSGGFVRSLRIHGQSDVGIETGRHFELTIQVSSNFRTERRSPGRYEVETGGPGRMCGDGPGERFKLAIEGDCRAVQLQLPVERFEQILLEDHDEPRGMAALRPIRGQVDHGLLSLLGRAIVVEDPLRETAVRGVLARLVTTHGDEGRKFYVKGLSPAHLRRIRDLVDSAPATVTLESMAAEARLSVYHFAREFRRETGQTPWEYVTQRRVWEAVRLLTEGGQTVDVIARKVGFAHASHMGRSFRKVLGMPPSTVADRLFR